MEDIKKYNVHLQVLFGNSKQKIIFTHIYVRQLTWSSIYNVNIPAFKYNFMASRGVILSLGVGKL